MKTSTNGSLHDFPKTGVKKKINLSVRPSFLHWIANARKKGHYFCHNNSLVSRSHVNIKYSLFLSCAHPVFSFFAREVPRKYYSVSYIMSRTQVSCAISTYDHGNDTGAKSPNFLIMAPAHDLNKIRALKFKSWCMQVAQLQKQRPEQDP